MQKWERYWSFKKNRLEENNLNQYNNRKAFRYKRNTFKRLINSAIIKYKGRFSIPIRLI